MLTKIDLHKKILRPGFTRINPLKFLMCLLQNGETDCCEGKHEDNDGILRISIRTLLETASTSAE